METAVIIAIVTGISGIVSSLIALWANFHKDGRRNDVQRQADLTKQAEQITVGLRLLMSDQEKFFQSQISDLNKTIVVLRNQIQQMKGSPNA